MRSEATKRRTHLHDAGFTFAEYLAVIMIVGILTAIAIPGFLNGHNYAPTMMTRLVTDEQTVYSQYGKYGSLIDLQSADPNLGRMIKNDGVNVSIIMGVVTPSVQITVHNSRGSITRLLRGKATGQAKLVNAHVRPHVAVD